MPAVALRQGLLSQSSHTTYASDALLVVRGLRNYWGLSSAIEHRPPAIRRRTRFSCRAALLRVGRGRCRGWRRRVPQPGNRAPRGMALAAIPSDLPERATAAVRPRIARSDTKTVPERENDPRAGPIARSNMPPAGRAPTAPPALQLSPLSHQTHATRDGHGPSCSTPKPPPQDRDRQTTSLRSHVGRD